MYIYNSTLAGISQTPLPPFPCSHRWKSYHLSIGNPTTYHWKSYHLSWGTPYKIRNIRNLSVRKKRARGACLLKGNFLFFGKATHERAPSRHFSGWGYINSHPDRKNHSAGFWWLLRASLTKRQKPTRFDKHKSCFVEPCRLSWWLPSWY